jgi:hypothetical protein
MPVRLVLPRHPDLACLGYRYTKQMRTVQTIRYVLPLREGGSLPAIVEADDLGLYVLKFRGAGQGPLALVAELVAGEIGRALGLKVPELVFAEVDAALGRNEPDAEIRHLLKASTGLNLALDYLPGSTTFDPAAGDRATPEIASLAVWFDAFVQNVDRNPRNPNLLMWHHTLYFIDHGAALYFHHDWGTAEEKAESPFAAIKQHVLLPWASAIAGASELAHQRLTPAVLHAILEQVPDAWIASGSKTAEERRAQYLAYLSQRLAAAVNFQQEAIRAHQSIV